jgi:hypothetical protein
MEELIRQAFLHVEGLGPHVAEGHYDLIGQGGQIILPLLWEEIIEPGWSITMHMWPMPQPPKPGFLPGPPPGHHFRDSHGRPHSRHGHHGHRGGPQPPPPPPGNWPGGPPPGGGRPPTGGGLGGPPVIVNLTRGPPGSRSTPSEGQSDVESSSKSSERSLVDDGFVSGATKRELLSEEQAVKLMDEFLATFTADVKNG